MARFLEKVQTLISDFQSFKISHVPQTKNTQADLLSWLVTSIIGSLGRTYIKHLEVPSIDKSIRVNKVNHEASWMEPIIKYLTDEVLLDDPTEAKQIR